MKYFGIPLTSGQGGHIQQAANLFSAAGDMSATILFTRLAVVGSQADQSGNLMAIESTQFRQMRQEHGAGLRAALIFGVNYFLSGRDGKFLNEVRDKAVWLKWMELRVHGDVHALLAPTGYIPRYTDLERLFKQVLGKEYSTEQYIEQFTIRIPENLEKVERVMGFHRTHLPDAPQAVFDILVEQRERLETTKKRRGEYVSPFDLYEVSLGKGGD